MEYGLVRSGVLAICGYLAVATAGSFVVTAGSYVGAHAASSSALSEVAKPMMTEEEINKRLGRSHKSNSLKHVGDKHTGSEHSVKLTNRSKPLLTKKNAPKATQPIFEWGDPFLKKGNIAPGFTLPTGAVWQPGLWVFGDFRTGGGYYDGQLARKSQYGAASLNLFFNLKLSGTERILFGINPLREGPEDTGFVHRHGRNTEFDNGFNARITRFFFEGEFGEIFPRLDPDDNKGLDFGFAIGRQPLFFQDGVMLNDTVDALGITRDTIIIPGLTPDMRVTGVFGFNNINRANNRTDNGALLFGLFTETDVPLSTIDVDMAYVDSHYNQGGSGVFLGVSATQRLWGDINTTFSVNGSIATGHRGPAMDDGVLLFSQISKTVTGSENILYGNTFVGIGHYTSAARDDRTGGPLGRAGILFAAPAVGPAGPALSNQGAQVVGGALGYQMFFNGERTQLVLELGGRIDTDGDDDSIAVGAQWLHALDNRSSLQVDGFVSESRKRGFGSGLRMELRTRF